MTRYKLHICFALVFMAVGLAFGANAYSGGSVWVLLPSSLASPLSVNNRGAQAALQTANAVLAPAGFVGSRVIAQNAYASGELAVFSRDVSFGNPTACTVLAGNNGLVFSFVESGLPQSGSATSQLCNQLAGALRARFGAGSVTVRLR
jgi:hypothetical protein